MLTTYQVQPWLSELCFPESPRWHNNMFYFVDMYEGEIWCSANNKSATLLLKWPNFVAGLGWLPCGDLLFVDMEKRCVMRLAMSGDVFKNMAGKVSDKVTLHADLSTLATGMCNDMVVDDEGRAFVGNFGYDIHNNADFRKTPLIVVEANGQAKHCSTPLAFPNGMVCFSDKRALIVAESVASRLVKFDINEQNNLVNRKVFAKIENGFPDGICLDSESGIWVASIGHTEVLRFDAKGNIVARVVLEDQPIACMLSPFCHETNTATLYITTAPKELPSEITPEVNAPISYRNRRQGGVVKVLVPYGLAGFL